MYTAQQNPPQMWGSPDDRTRVYIDNSLLLNREGRSIGKGLFAKTLIRNIIFSYWGKVISTKIAKYDRYESDYVLQCSAEWSIDSKAPLSSYGRYCNDPMLPDKINADLIGTDFDGSKENVIGHVEAKDIKAGEEIYVSDGVGYWCHPRYSALLGAEQISYLMNNSPQFRRYYYDIIVPVASIDLTNDDDEIEHEIIDLTK
jgi:hypothetical protein